MRKMSVKITRYKNDRNDEITGQDIRTPTTNIPSMLKYLEETWGMVR